MSNNINRRNFTKQAVACASALALGMGMNRKASAFNQDILIHTGDELKSFPIAPPLTYSKKGITANLTIDEVVFRDWGAKIPMYGYNKLAMPNPLIELHQYGEHKIFIKNNLKSDTTVHWHGLDIDIDSDGNPHTPIKPGGKKNHFLNMKHVRPGTYWYHPHPHGDIGRQISLGLAGALIVRDKESPLPINIQENILIFTDLSLNTEDKSVLLTDSKQELSYGREGDLILVNGQLKPKLTIARNSTQRFRLINATASRFLLCNFDGAPMIQIGSDGGYLERPREIKQIFLTPSERMDVIVHFSGDSGQVFSLRPEFYARGKAAYFSQKPLPDKLMDVVLDERIGELANLPNEFEKIADLGEPEHTHRLIMAAKYLDPSDMEAIHEYHNTLGPVHKKMAMHDSIVPDIAFTFNNKLFDINRIDLQSKLGRVEMFEIANNTEMDHPFHIHGGQFQVIEHGYNKKITKPEFKQWKDTINVRSGELIRLKMKQNYKGIKMFHCHILDHEDHGMMGMMKVS